MFEALQQMAKMDGEGQGVSAEDKDQLNYYVIIIGSSFSLLRSPILGKEEKLTS